MINSHKELVNEVLLFGEKMELVKKMEYLTDIESADQHINKIDRRGIVFGITALGFGDDYNNTITYGFTIIDGCNDTLEEVLTSEEENLFVLSSLYDYLNYVADAEIDMNNLQSDTLADKRGVSTSISGFFVMNVKRSPSYWKKMETYSQD